MQGEVKPSTDSIRTTMEQIQSILNFGKKTQHTTHIALGNFFHAALKCCHKRIIMNVCLFVLPTRPLTRSLVRSFIPFIRLLDTHFLPFCVRMRSRPRRCICMFLK